MKNEQDLYVFISDKTSDWSANTLRISLTVCVRNARDDAPHGIGRMFECGDWRTGYNFLEVTATVWADQPGGTGFITLRSTDSLGGEEMPSLAHTLKASEKIQAALKKLESAAGPCDTAGAYFTRFAHAIKAKGMIRRSPRPDTCGDWQVLDTSYIASVVNGIVHDFHAKNAQTAAA